MSARAMSAAVVVGNQRERAQITIDALGSQTAAERIEVVVVDIGPEDAPDLPTPPGMPATYVRMAGARGFAAARAEAARRASTPVVAYLEDHAVPDVGWAAAVSRAHEGPWAAVGYAFTNANPESFGSRVSYIADYGPWAHPAPHGPLRLLPGNNVAYKRAALLSLGERLDDLLVVDFNVQHELRSQGRETYLESGALVAHENFARVTELFAANYSYTRLMAMNRAAGWSLGRRLGYAALVPVAVPGMKLARLLRSLRGRRQLWGSVALALPFVLANYAWSSIGEARGYLGGDLARAESAFAHWELDTVRS
jgi:hypothetical protein